MSRFNFRLMTDEEIQKLSIQYPYSFEDIKNLNAVVGDKTELMLDKICHSGFNIRAVTIQMVNIKELGHSKSTVINSGSEFATALASAAEKAAIALNAFGKRYMVAAASAYSKQNGRIPGSLRTKRMRKKI